MKALWSIPIAAALTCAALSAEAAEPLKQQLVGTWRVTSFVNLNEKTGKTTQAFGSDPKGYFMFDAANHFSINPCVRDDQNMPAATFRCRRKPEPLWRG